MTDRQHDPVPTEIQLHQKSRLLEISFEDGAHFKLPCEYLRVFSPSAEVQAARKRGEWVTGKQNVNIERISQVGNYAIQLYFDDSHDTGVYSWKRLYELGVNREKNWQVYLDRSQAADRQVADDGPLKVKLLYFVNLVDDLGRASEEVELPTSVRDVKSLIIWLRQRGGQWDAALGRTALKITVNKQFVDPDTRLTNKDEIAIVPTPH